MTVETNSPPTSAPAGGDTSADQRSNVARMADTTGSELSNVASTAKESAKEVAGEATAQTKVVMSQARQQVGTLVDQTKGEVRQQAEGRSAQAAGGLRTLSEQVAALAEGRPESAGSLPRYLEDVQDQVRGLASRLEERGPQGVVDDMSSFARRRPGLFLAGAVGAGFVVGRLVRASSGQPDSPSVDGETRP
jgi:hypothetical protein